MTTDERAEYELRLKDMFSGPLMRIEERLNGFERHFGSLQGKIAGGIFGGALMVKGAEKAVELIESISRSVLELGTNMEKTRITFTTLFGGDKGFADQMISQFQKFAQNTPFSSKEVVDGAKRLRAYRYEADEIIPTMKKLGDITAGLDLNFSDVVWLVGHTKSLGYMDRRILREFTLRGIGIDEGIEKSKGITHEEFEGQIRERKITYKDIDKALTAMTEKGGMFYNLSDKLAQSVSGRWERIKDTVEILETKWGESFLPLLAKWEDKIFSLLSNLGNWRASSLIATVDTLATSIEGLAKSMYNITTLFPRFSDHSYWESLMRIMRATGYVGEMASLANEKAIANLKGHYEGSKWVPEHQTQSWGDLFKGQDKRESDIQKHNKMSEIFGFDTYGMSATQIADKLNAAAGGIIRKQPHKGNGIGEDDEGTYAGAGIEKISSGTRNIYLTINKLIESVTFEQSIEVNENKLKDMVTRAVLTAVNDVNHVAG